MKSKSIFLIAVSLGFGLVAAIGMTQVMGRNKAEPVAEVPKESVLVAVEDLDINSELKPEMFRVEEWPAEYIPEAAVSTVEEIEGKALTARVRKNGVVLIDHLANANDVRAKHIPAGFKVFGVTLGSDDHLYGLLEPGDLVDLIAVFRNNRNTGPSSQTFLRKVRVYNIGSNTSKDPEGRTGVKGNVVVGLLVTEKQSEQIALVDNVAELKLAMRSDQENEDELAENATGGTSLGDLTGIGDANKTVNSDGLAQLLAQSMTAATTSRQPEPQQEKEEPKVFRMTIYTSEGPTQYQFDTEAGNVPQRFEGFGGQSATQPVSQPDQATSQPAGEPQQPQEPVIDLDGDAADEDSDLLIDELDSEPGA